MCRKRISVWVRHATKSNSLINQTLWKKIQTTFPERIQARTNGEGDCPDDGKFSYKSQIFLTCDICLYTKVKPLILYFRCSNCSNPSACRTWWNPSGIWKGKAKTTRRRGKEEEGWGNGFCTINSRTWGSARSWKSKNSWIRKDTQRRWSLSLDVKFTQCRSNSTSKSGNRENTNFIYRKKANQEISCWRMFLVKAYQ